MPNWCNSIVKVKGKPEDIENFCKLFVFEEDTDKDKLNKKYFARSFTQMTFKDFKKKYLGKSEAEFMIDFAWSCWSCMFEGYPNGIDCVTLEWAIKENNVKVEITTEEGGEGFEEHITTKNGKPIYKSVNIPSHKCLNCGNKQLIPSSYDLDKDEVECYNCGKIAWKDELKELIKQKIKKIRK